MAKRNSILKRAAGQKHFKYLAGYQEDSGGYIIEKKTTSSNPCPNMK